MKDEMFLTLKNHKERMAFIENSDNWMPFQNDSDLLEMRHLFIGERVFVRMMVYEQEFPWCDKSFTDAKENPPKWVRLEQFEIRSDDDHIKYFVKVSNTELCDVLAKYQRKLRKEMQK